MFEVVIKFRLPKARVVPKIYQKTPSAWKTYIYLFILAFGLNKIST